MARRGPDQYYPLFRKTPHNSVTVLQIFVAIEGGLVMRELGMWYSPSLMRTAGTGIPSPSVLMKALLENNLV
jgi:hypothetical protein